MKLTINKKTFENDELDLLLKQRKNKVLLPWESAFFNFLEEWLDSSDIINAYTSGSTGTPKKIILYKEKMLASATLTNHFFNLKENDKIWTCLSSDYIAGKMMIVRAWLGNLHLIVSKPSSYPTVEENVQLAAMVPMQVESLLNDSEGLKTLNRINQLIIGGSPLNEKTEQSLQLLNTGCYMTYGMTETVSHVALRKLNGNNKSLYYKALKNISFSTDNRNCLVINAPHLQAEPFISNDVVEIISSTLFRWIGRYDHVINSGGIKLFPEKIEKQISDLLNCRFFITSLPDNLLGEKAVLVLEKNELSDKDKKELILKIKERLGKYELPREIICISHFQETTTGKIKRVIH